MADFRIRPGLPGAAYCLTSSLTLAENAEDRRDPAALDRHEQSARQYLRLIAHDLGFDLVAKSPTYQEAAE